MPKKDPYGQFCPVALTLDTVGDRWTLLVIRELFCGPLRFGEIRAGVGRIASDVLTKRLRRLVEDGIITHNEDKTYGLSGRGRQLLPLLHEMGKWGWGQVGEAPDEPITSREILTLIALGPMAIAPQPESTTELRISDLRRWVMTSEQGIRVSSIGSPTPDSLIEVDDETLSAVLLGGLSWQEAVDSGRLKHEGAPTFLSSFLDGLIPNLFEVLEQEAAAALA